jgi:cyclophilin family peptidyl-prolyl cis-trans isomerase
MTSARLRAIVNPNALLHSSLGDITIELFSDKMTITAGNFIKLAKDGSTTVSTSTA